MAIQTSELKIYKSKTVDDSSANGGRMSAVEIVDSVKNNLWPSVPQAERVAGSTKYRKTFIKAENDADLAYINAKIFVETQSPGDDIEVLFPGTQRDTQTDITGAERLYGTGNLASDISAGATTIIVNTEDGTLAVFQPGDLIRISDMTDVNDATGNEEYLRLDAASGAVSFSGDQATLLLASGVSTIYSYLSADTRAASCIEAGDVKAGFDNKQISSASGTYDEITNPIAVDHIGGVEETWTITFTGATTFDVVGDSIGSVGSGSTGSDLFSTNPDFTKPYFTLLSAGWGGTWASADTLSFQTHPASSPVWEKRIVPAGAASLSANQVIVGYDGESE